MNNDGERVALVASNGTTLASVSYKSNVDWPSRANGDGSSLEPRTPYNPPFEEALEYSLVL